MPILFHRMLKPKGELGIWEITETEDFFLEQLKLNADERLQFNMLKGRKRTEWLAARQLVHHMSGREVRGSFIKDEFGKPHLEHSPFNVSISHSGNKAAAIAAPDVVGIDIQNLVPKIERLAHRFLNKEELDSLREETRILQLHVLWGAKEALYKAYGRRQLDFCANIRIRPFEFDLTVGTCKGMVEKEDYAEEFNIFYEQMDDYVLVYCRLEKD